MAMPKQLKYKGPKVPPQRKPIMKRTFDMVFTYNLRDGEGDKTIQITANDIPAALGVFDGQFHKVNPDYFIGNIAITERE